VKRAANTYQLPALLLNKSINWKYKGTTEMATINGTAFNDNNTFNNGQFRPSLVGTDQQWQQGPNGPVLTTGNDEIYGFGGNDIIYGRAGSDFLSGGSGDDNIYGGDGSNVGNNITHNDTLYGGAGNDKLYGEGGNDKLYGEGGNDLLTGGSGNDYLNGFGGGLENDTLTGGANADTFVLGKQLVNNFYTGAGLAVITDFNSAEGDKIALFQSSTQYIVQFGNFGYGGAALDTKISFGLDVIAVLQDTTNVQGTDFILG
jgi:Ca2+-binding RTX toxin-like protein